MENPQQNMNQNTNVENLNVVMVGFVVGGMFVCCSRKHIKKKEKYERGRIRSIARS
jgi:hypothetical protein